LAVERSAIKEVELDERARVPETQRDKGGREVEKERGNKEERQSSRINEASGKQTGKCTEVRHVQDDGVKNMTGKFGMLRRKEA
jgi:hypothetical protein